MSTHFIQILSSHRPLLIPALDDNSRSVFSCNYIAEGVYPTENWIECVAELIEDEGLGTGGTNLFIGILPSLDANLLVIQLVDTGGASPYENHDSSKIERLSLQVLVRAKNPKTASDRAESIWKLLDGIRDTEITL